MKVLHPPCDSPRSLVICDQRVSSRRVEDERDAVLPSATRKKAVKRFAIEPYSAAILRPLTAACVFRDCSLRIQSAPPERRACRTLMRQAAIKWRHGLAMGDL
jgi:hypothetical protein